MNPALNAVVHNEAHRIIGLLEHAATYCDELIVVDQSSTDGTGDLARDFGATVIEDERRGLSELSRPLCEKNTRSEWILILDADETILPEKIPELVALDERWDGANFPRITYVDGVHIRTGADRQLRYFRKGCIQFSPWLHHRNVMKPCKALLHIQSDPWILHWKTSAEQLVDNSRYERIKAAGMDPLAGLALPAEEMV